MGNKGEPRLFNPPNKWKNRKTFVTHHPSRGTMLVKGTNWLVPIPSDFVWDSNVVVKDYNEKMRVKGAELSEGYYRRSIGQCKQCKKKLDVSRLVDGYCDKCYRLNDSLEDELKQLRADWRAGAMRLRRGEGMGW